MKLVTYDSGSGPAAGVVSGDQVLNAADLLSVAGGLRDVRVLLELPNEPLERLKGALGTARQGVALSQVRLLAPVLQPPSVRDFMVYEGHATGGGTRQQAEAWYRLPIFYFSNPLRIFGPDATVPYPSAAEVLDYEMEVGLVMARKAATYARPTGWTMSPASRFSTTGAAETCNVTSRLSAWVREMQGRRDVPRPDAGHS